MTSALTRRRLVRSGAAIAVGGPVAAFLASCGGDGSDAATTSTTTAPPPRSPEEALERLLAGNQRFVSGEPLNAGRDDLRRAEIAEEQKPFAAILGCSDSRVPPDVVFDQGLGDLFVVRIAGNTVTEPVVVGSLEYAAEHLGSILLMVLGHQKCGAVTAAVAAVTEDAHEPGSIDAFVDPIVPVVERVRRSSPQASHKALTERSIRANVARSVEELTNSEALLSHLVEDGKLMIVGAEYELHSGRVEVL